MRDIHDPPATANFRKTETDTANGNPPRCQNASVGVVFAARNHAQKGPTRPATRVDSRSAPSDPARTPQGEAVMRATNEVVVARADLLEAVTVGADAPPRELRRAGVTLLHWRGGRLAIETPTLTAEVEAAGRWETPVAVDAVVLRRLVTKLPDAPTVTVIYVIGRLHVGPTSVPASNASLEVQDVQDGGGQLLMPGMAPVSDRERLERLARAPMRPRRR